MDDDENMEFEVEFPAFPFVQSAAIADVLELAATNAEATAELMRAFATRMQADHNHKVDLQSGMEQAAQEIETLVKGGESDGDG